MIWSDVSSKAKNENKQQYIVRNDDGNFEAFDAHSSFVLLIRLFVLSDNSRVVSQYTDLVEEQHVYIKETVDTVFPSNIRVLQVNTS